MENYEKIRLVGRGAHGTVYLCKQKVDNKLVILKEIPVDQMSVDERQTSLNEAKVLKMLDHPNIIAYYENFLEDKTMIIVMEYVQGGTLFDFFNQRNGNLLTEMEVLHYFGQMVYTLQHVHRKSILHRDLKSQNILLNEKKNIVKIGDFGISKILTTKSKAYTVVGTPCYISPELCEGKPYNQKSDIWSLGCLLYELMTLKRPFDACTLPALVMKIMKGDFEPVPDIYSYELRNLLASMLHLDPNQRPTAAQIMCNPVMIKTIFKLYMEIGCIPYKKSSEMSIESSFSKVSISGFDNLPANSESTDTLKSENVPPKEKICSKIWYFESKSPDVIILPHPPNTSIKYVGLGFDHRIGFTESGHLISWNINTQITQTLDLDCHKHDKTSMFDAVILDERIAINIIAVACGKDFTVCLSNEGVVFTFGKASTGCLGLSSEREIHQPRIVEKLFGHHIISIACGPRHVLVLSDENEIFSWGHGVYGCLGLGESEFQMFPKVVQISSDEKPVKIFCGDDTSFIITENQSLLACGSNRHNKLAMDTGESNPTDETRVFKRVIPFSSTNIVSVAAGKSHTVILNELGEVYTVGSNRFCQLGWGGVGLDYSMPQKVEKLRDLKISQVTCGDFFTLVVTSDNYLYCWGRCPRSLTGIPDSMLFDVGMPNLFTNRYIQSISSNAESCVIISMER